MSNYQHDSDQLKRQRLAKALGRRDFWVSAFQASLPSSFGASDYPVLDAAELADLALKQYDSRFESL